MKLNEILEESLSVLKLLKKKKQNVRLIIGVFKNMRITNRLWS